MKLVLRRRLLPLAATLCSALLFAAFIHEARQGADTPEPRNEQSLKRFLRKQNYGVTTRYIAAFRDLNGDGKTEAIVYLIGSDWCGTGGCNTLVLTPDGTSWKAVTSITITRPPIRVLTNVSNGWHSIGVWVEGGGILPGYEAELRFNGKTYPRNPSVPPARRIEGKVTGEVAISSTEEPKPLYDSAQND